MEEKDIKEQFILLRAEGCSFNKIAKKLNKAKGTLLEWNKELAEEISNCKALQLESLYEKYFLLQESRLQLFGEVLLVIKKELAKRNFANISTEKLLEFLLKYYSLLKEEYIEPKFSTESEIQEKKTERLDLEKFISRLSKKET
ncbi:hypothetical protein [Emticicia sp. C21]|uniref:hypothetical protein n=1 Tax=Emticicia sp. C21 TaxID=2302915 RepID=UPI000E34A14B|nr:hypothetical protein [Emticicia sp. C21]RFS17359.1 hypothetical protein D0T08_06155 [Emticicia sp. C21]